MFREVLPKFLRIILKIFKKNFENYYGKFRKVFYKILKNILENSEKYIGKVRKSLWKISEDFEKYFLNKFRVGTILENVENFFGKFWEVFRKISKIIPENFNKYFGKIKTHIKFWRTIW